MIAFTIASGFVPAESILAPILILLVPTIIIEIILLKNLLKKSWGEAFECSTIANIASSAAVVISVFILFPILSLMEKVSGGIDAIIIWLYLISIPFILVWIENAVAKKYWKDISKKKLLKAVITANIVSLAAVFVIMFFMPAHGRPREKSRRISCSSNLKQIGLALKCYAEDNNKFFPNEGLEQLRVNDYLTDYGIFHCPSSKLPKGRDNQKLNDGIVSYKYRKGLKYNAGAQNSQIPIVWDKPENHIGYGNVLFLDGHIKGYKDLNGESWMTRAGITESANN